MRSTAALAALLLLTACSAEPASRAAAPTPGTPAPATPTAAASPSAAPSADPSGLLVAVVRGKGGLELHRVSRTTRAATLERVLAPPAAGATALDVSGSPAQLCATWYVGAGEPFEQERTALVCYPEGSSSGTPVSGPARPVEVALSADGTSIAWADLDRGENQVLSTARIADGVLSGPRRHLARAGQPETGERAFTGTAVQDLAWIDEDELAISTGAESDDGPALLRFDVDAAGGGGWLDDGRPVEVRTKGYQTYDSVVSVDGPTALAVERGGYLDEAAPPQRAVRIDLVSGRVLEVLATAAGDRLVTGVSGGAQAVVYLTGSGPGPVRTYLRLAGESRGTTVTGLPADTEQVLALG